MFNDHKAAPRQCFPRRCRLISATEYSEVFSKSNRINGNGVTLLVRANSLGWARLGLAVSKKQIPTAVARNRIKRLARESFRVHLTTLPSVDIVVIAYKGLLTLSKLELQNNLNGQWKKLLEQYKQV